MLAIQCSVLSVICRVEICLFCLLQLFWMKFFFFLKEFTPYLHVSVSYWTMHMNLTSDMVWMSFVTKYSHTGTLFPVVVELRAGEAF